MLGCSGPSTTAFFCCCHGLLEPFLGGRLLARLELGLLDVVVAHAKLPFPQGAAHLLAHAVLVLLFFWRAALLAPALPAV